MAKKRVTNFTQLEKDTLIELVKQYPEIENKGYDSKSLDMKAKAWDAILKCFNTVCTIRNLKALQGLWKRVKEKTKKDIDCFRKLTKASKTGKGAPPPSLDNSTRAVAAFIGLRIECPDNQDRENGSSSIKSSNSADEYASETSLSESCQCHTEIESDECLTAIQDAEKASILASTRPLQLSLKRKLREDDDEFLMMAREEHKAKMRIFKLMEWKLRKECLLSGLGLPEHESSDVKIIATMDTEILDM